MRWCLAIGAVLYTALIGTFIGIFKKYTMAFRSYHTTVALQEKTANLSVEERNKAYKDMTKGCKAQRKAMKKQVVAAPQQQSQYLPPCVAPTLENSALTQRLVAPS